MWKRLKLIKKENAPVILFGAEPFSSYLRISNIKEYKYDWYWKKTKYSNFLCLSFMPAKDIENICVFYNKKPTYNPQMREGKPYVNKGSLKVTNNQQKIGCKVYTPIVNTGKRFPSSLIEFSNSSNKNLHPTQKPLALMEYLIKTYTNEGDTVLDFTMGSGTTGVACIKTNRNFIGIEFNPEKDKEGNLLEPAKYFNIAVDRIKKESEK